jgi:hypothetical protein
MKTGLIALLFLSPALPLCGQTCASSNTGVRIVDPNTGLVPTIADSAEHATGQHSVTFGTLPAGGATATPSGLASCTYTHSASTTQQNCNVQCAVVNGASDNLNPLAGITPAESGTLSPFLPTRHAVGIAFDPGFSSATNGGTECIGSLGGAAASCGLLNINCSINISVAASANPSVTVTNVNGTTIWTKAIAIKNTCNPIPDPENQSGGGGGCFQLVTDSSGFSTLQTCGDTSPIIIDTEGEGFHLTSSANGVLFDIRGDGHPVQISWTAPGSHNAFLALDRNGDGHITSGKELFGNFTLQPVSGNPNGFLALAEFDKPENGGNGDGVIDDQDRIFPQLVLWIDENHDGISQPNEIHTLPELGIHSLSVNYFESRRNDEFGNQFRYKARVNPDRSRRDSRDETLSGEPGRWAYDVFLTSTTK